MPLFENCKRLTNELTLTYVKIFSIAVYGAGQHLDRPVLVLEHEFGRALHSYDLRLRKEQAVVQRQLQAASTDQQRRVRIDRYRCELDDQILLRRQLVHQPAELHFGHRNARLAGQLQGFAQTGVHMQIGEAGTTRVVEHMAGAAQL